MGSLQDQLLQTGLATQQQAKKIKTEKRRQTKSGKGKEAKAALANEVAQAKAKQQAQDRELNERQQEAKRHQEERAQVEQLLRQHQVKDQAGEVPFNVLFKGKVKKVYVSETVRQGLVQGSLGVCRFDGRFIVVSDEVARRIDTIRAGVVVHLNQGRDEVDTDDPYADYQVPDDLIW